MKLFCPGPVMVSDQVKKAITKCEIGHRSSTFEKLYNDIRNKILRLASADSSYDTVVLSASGSAVNEAVVASVFKSTDNILVVSNGVFGERVEAILNTYNLNFDIYSETWGEEINLLKLEEMLQVKQYDYLFITHHETSVGMINPIEKIGNLCQKYNIKFFVDAVSSFGGEEIDVVSQNIDIMTSVSGKCVGGVPGASFVVMKKQIFNEIKENNVSNIYLNLNNYYKFAKKNQTPNTPNIVAFQSLNVALDECISNPKQITYKINSDYLRNQLEAMGITLLIDREKMSNTVTTFILPQECDMVKIYQALESKGYILYLTKGKLQELGAMQVAVMGNIAVDDCKDLINILRKEI